MEAEFKRQGIIYEMTAPYAPEQDEVAEHMNQTLVTRSTTMLVDWVRVYQPKDAHNIGCDPPDYPTADYINT